MTIFEQKYSDEIIKDLWKDYSRLGTIKEVAKKSRISAATLSLRFRKMGFVVKPSPVGKRIRNFNEDFFATDTPESFYWAGFIAADGCVSTQHRSSHYLSIGLSYMDKNHLEKFAQSIGFDGKITNQVSICSKKIFDDLSRFNIVPRKSLSYKFPEQIKKHKYINHFIRGYFDGDGSVWVSNSKNKNKISFCVCGTYWFLSSCRELFSNIGLNPNIKIIKNKGIYQLEYCGNNNAIKFRDFLYKDSTNDILMDRKKERFYLLWVDNKPRSNRCKAVEAISSNKILLFDAVVDTVQYGFDKSCVQDCLKDRVKTHKGYSWRYLNG